MPLRSATGRPALTSTSVLRSRIWREAPDDRLDARRGCCVAWISALRPMLTRRVPDVQLARRPVAADSGLRIRAPAPAPVVMLSPAWMSMASARLTFLSRPADPERLGRPMICAVAARATAWSREAGTDGPGAGNATSPTRSPGWSRSMKRRAASIAPRAPRGLKLAWSMARKIRRPLGALGADCSFELKSGSGTASGAGTAAAGLSRDANSTNSAETTRRGLPSIVTSN